MERRCQLSLSPLQDQMRFKTTSKHLCHICVTGWAGSDPGRHHRQAGRGKGGCCPSPTGEDVPLHPPPSLALLHTEELFLKVCQSALAFAGEGCTEKRVAGALRQQQTVSKRHTGCLRMAGSRAGSWHCLCAETEGHSATMSCPGHPGG